MKGVQRQRNTKYKGPKQASLGTSNDCQGEEHAGMCGWGRELHSEHLQAGGDTLEVVTSEQRLNTGTQNAY